MRFVRLETVYKHGVLVEKNCFFHVQLMHFRTERMDHVAGTLQNVNLS